MPKSSVLLHRINNHFPTSSQIIPRRESGGKQQQQPVLPPTNSCTDDENNFDIPDDVVKYHTEPVGLNQCCSVVVQEINSPVQTVWSVVRRFDAPQVYKHFVRSCVVISGDGDVGRLRRICVVSGLPATVSDERLEIIDDRLHVISFSIVGGDHRLSNYRSVTPLHSGPNGSTVVLETYVVDTPTGNTKEETCVFVDTIVRCNLQSLARTAVKRDSAKNNG